MLIETIRLHSVGVYRDDQVIRPSTATDKPITLIGGMNGSGKTTLREAVLLALYGSRSPCVGRSGLSYTGYLRRFSSKYAAQGSTSFVELDLRVSNDSSSDSITLRRSWNKGIGRRITDRLDVRRNGTPDPFLGDVWDSYVAELAPRSIVELFFFDGENVFVTDDPGGTPEALKSAMRDLLGITIIEQAIHSLDRVISKNTKAISDEEARSTLLSLEDRKRRIMDRMSRVRQAIQETESNLQLLEEDSMNAKNAYLNLRGQVTDARKSVEAHQAEVGEELAEVKARMIELATGPFPLLILPSELQRLRERLTDEEKIRAARSALPILKRHKEELNEELNSALEDSALDPDTTDCIRRRVNRFMELQQQMIKDRADSACFIAVSPRGTAQLNDLLSNRQSELITLAQHLIARQLALTKDQERNSGYLDIETDDSEIALIVQTILERNKEIGAMKERREYLTSEYDQLQKYLSEIDRQMCELGRRMALDEEAARIIKFGQEGKIDLVHFMEKATERKVMVLEHNMKNAFGLLTNRSEVDRVRIEPTSLVVRLFDGDGVEVDKSSLSSGERQMLALAILWGLAKSTERELPVIIDTPMSRLDSSHRSSFVSNYLLNAGKQVIVLSTDTEIVDKHYDQIRPYVGRHYLLSYEVDNCRTRVVEDYFEA